MRSLLHQGILKITMTAPSPPTLDPIAAQRWQRTAPEVSPWLHEEVARRMLERLQWIKQQPKAWAHWGAVRGGLQAHLQLCGTYPAAKCFVVDETEAHRRVATEQLAKSWRRPRTWRSPATQFGAPPRAGVNMLWANMLLHLAPDPQDLLTRWYEALAEEGFLLFSCLGPDTAMELRQLYHTLGWPPASHDLVDMHDWGDMLVHTGFSQPVMDMERITLTYSNPQRLLQELREIGRNMHPQRFTQLRSRNWAQKLEQAIQAHFKPQANGQLALTFELIYGHAFKPSPRARVSTQSTISLAQMRTMLNKGASL